MIVITASNVAVFLTLTIVNHVTSQLVGKSRIKKRVEKKRLEKAGDKLRIFNLL